MGRFCCLITPSSLIKQENDYRGRNSSKYHQGIARLHRFPTGTISQWLDTRAGLLEIPIFSRAKEPRAGKSSLVPFCRAEMPQLHRKHWQDPKGSRVLSLIWEFTDVWDRTTVKSTIRDGSQEETFPALFQPPQFSPEEVRRRGYIQPR